MIITIGYLKDFGDLALGRDIWSILPDHLLTRGNFQRLLTAAEDVNPKEEIQHVVDKILASRGLHKAESASLEDLNLGLTIH